MNDDTFRREYYDDVENLKRAGISEDEYIASRRQSEGLPAGADAAELAAPENAAFVGDYHVDRAMLSAAGISAQDYFRSRRVSAGLEPLLARG